MPKKVHYQTEIKLDINFINSHIEKDTPLLIADTLRKVWPDTYLSDLDVEDHIEIVTDLWIKNYVSSPSTKEAIGKIRQANPPENLKIYLSFNLFDDEDYLKIDISEISITPLFKAYLPTKDLWDSYIYDLTSKKFESLEIIEPSYIDEIKLSMTDQEKINFDDLILKSYEFHNKLLEKTPRKIRLYTAQQPSRIDEWNKTGIIPTGIYFASSLQRAEYHWEEGDIIVYYIIPENKIVQTSEFGAVKEYVTIEDIPIK